MSSGSIQRLWFDVGECRYLGSQGVVLWSNSLQPKMWRLAISDFSILASGSKMTSTCGKESSDFWRIIFGVVQPYCPIFPLENFKTSQHLLSSYVQERSPWILDGIGGMCCIKTNSTRMLSWYLLSQIRPHEMRCSYFCGNFVAVFQAAAWPYIVWTAVFSNCAPSCNKRASFHFAQIVVTFHPMAVFSHLKVSALLC